MSIDESVETVIMYILKKERSKGTHVHKESAEKAHMPIEGSAEKVLVPTVRKV